MRCPSLLLLLFVACAPDSASTFERVRPLELDQCSGFFQVNTVETFVFVGQPSTVLFAVRGGLMCSSGLRDIEALSVEVSDGEGVLEARVVESTSAPTAKVLEVTFTPRRTGQVLVTVRAEPMVGFASTRLEVLRLEGRQWQRGEGAGCWGLVRAPGGRQLCFGTRGLEVPLTGAATLTEFPAAVASTSSRLFVFGPSQVMRYAFDDGGARQVGATPMARPLAVQVIDDRVYVVDALGLSMLDEAGVKTGPISLTPDTPMVTALQARDGQLALGRADRLDLVPLPLDGGAGLVLPEAMGDFTTAFAAREGVWFVDTMRLPARVGLHRLDGGLGSTELPWPVTFPLVVSPDGLPFARAFGQQQSFVVLPADRGDALELVALKLPEGANVNWVTSERLFASMSDGGLFIAPR